MRTQEGTMVTQVKNGEKWNLGESENEILEKYFEVEILVNVR